MLQARKSWAGPGNRAIEAAFYLCIEPSAPEYAAYIKDAISSSCWEQNRNSGDNIITKTLDITYQLSLVPRSYPAFRRLQYGKLGGPGNEAIPANRPDCTAARSECNIQSQEYYSTVITKRSFWDNTAPSEALLICSLLI